MPNRQKEKGTWVHDLPPLPIMDHWICPICARKVKGSPLVHGLYCDPLIPRVRRQVDAEQAEGKRHPRRA